MGAVDTPAFLVVQGLTVGVMLLWAARIWVSPKPQLLWPPLCWAVLAFAIYAVARYLTADIEYVARQEMIQVLVCVPVFRHRQQSLPAGNGANHRLHDDFSGDGHLRLGGLSIFHAFTSRLEFHFALCRAAPPALTFRLTIWRAFSKCCCRWRRPTFWPGG